MVSISSRDKALACSINRMSSTIYPNLVKLNPHIICKICNGYFIDPVTIVECLHSFCKTCIIKHVEKDKCCPTCNLLIHKTRPILSLRKDKALQDIVYKLVPGLFKEETERKIMFYRKNPNTDPEFNQADYIYFGSDEKMSLSIEYFDPCREKNRGIVDETFGVNDSNRNRRYLECPATLKVKHLKKFIFMKYGLGEKFIVDIIYRSQYIPEEYSLIDIAYFYNWRKDTPMEFYYRIFKRSKLLLKLKRKKESEMDSDKGSNESKITVSNVKVSERQQVSENSSSSTSCTTTKLSSSAITSTSDCFEEILTVPSKKPRLTKTEDETVDLLCLTGDKRPPTPPPSTPSPSSGVISSIDTASTGLTIVSTPVLLKIPRSTNIMGPVKEPAPIFASNNDMNTPPVTPTPTFKISFDKKNVCESTDDVVSDFRDNQATVTATRILGSEEVDKDICIIETAAVSSVSTTSIIQNPSVVINQSNISVGLDSPCVSEPISATALDLSAKVVSTLDTCKLSSIVSSNTVCKSIPVSSSVSKATPISVSNIMAKKQQHLAALVSQIGDKIMTKGVTTLSQDKVTDQSISRSVPNGGPSINITKNIPAGTTVTVKNVEKYSGTGSKEGSLTNVPNVSSTSVGQSLSSNNKLSVSKPGYAINMKNNVLLKSPSPTLGIGRRQQIPETQPPPPSIDDTLLKLAAAAQVQQQQQYAAVVQAAMVAQNRAAVGQPGNVMAAAVQAAYGSMLNAAAAARLHQPFLTTTTAPGLNSSLVSEIHQQQQVNNRLQLLQPTPVLSISQTVSSPLQMSTTTSSQLTSKYTYTSPLLRPGGLQSLQMEPNSNPGVNYTRLSIPPKSLLNQSVRQIANPSLLKQQHAAANNTLNILPKTTTSELTTSSNSSNTSNGSS